VAYAALILLGCVVLLPALCAAVVDLIRKPVDLPWRMHLHVVLRSLVRPAAHGLLLLTFLPYEAYFCADAIVRTLVRVGWTRRRLLEWKTASDSERSEDESLEATYRQMCCAPALAAAALIVLAFYHPQVLPAAGPLIAAWLASPLVAWWLSQPLPPPTLRLSEHQRQFLEMLARKTWRYFEEFVSATDNWLPPDNIQQNPDLVIAPRTSPTNIGMALNADLAAYDFGYCSGAQFLERVELTLQTLGGLERYRGHFFNWYDTRSLAPLHPR
jgi:hypothetical protein